MPINKNVFYAIAAAIVLAVIVIALVGCASDADVASYNTSKAADMFEIERRVIFYNGITGEYMLTIEGRCSLGNQDTKLRMSVTCKTGEGVYKKHYLGLSDNVTFFVEQVEAKKQSAYHYRVIFKPQVIVPDIDVRIGK